MIATRDKPVLVVGGGLGGLSAALALGRQGCPVHILEQAHEISPIGYGIQLGPNVFKAFERLGIKEEVKAAADFPLALTMPDADSGKTLMRIPLQSDSFNARFDEPYVVIHRSDMHNVLLDACNRTPNITMTVNATFVDFADHGSEGVEVRCADGRVFHGTALIGADGIKSRARTLLVGDNVPRSAGYVAHRTMFDIALVPPELQHQKDVVLWAGPGYHVVHYPLRHGTIFNVVSVFKDPAIGRGDEHVTHEDDVKHVYANAQPVLKKLLSMMDLERRWVLGDRDPIRQWSKGHVTLLGDAVHPTLQSYAQGAGMAIEDAVCLADLLEQSNYDWAGAFMEYPKRRVVRSSRIVFGSRQLWEFYHAEGLARDVRNIELEGRTEENFYDCLSWIWNGDPSMSDAVKKPRAGALAGTTATGY